MFVHAKFTNYILSQKRKLHNNQNIDLFKECNALLQEKLPSNLKDSDSFTTPCIIGKVNVEIFYYI